MVDIWAVITSKQRGEFCPSLRAPQHPAALHHGLGRPVVRGVYGDSDSSACERAVNVHPRYSLMDPRVGPGSLCAAISQRRGEGERARSLRAGTPRASTWLRVEMNDVGTTYVFL